MSSRYDAPVRGVLFYPSGDLNLGGEGFQLFSGGSFFLVPSSANPVHAIRASESDRIREFQPFESERFLCGTAHETSATTRK